MQPGQTELLIPSTHGQDQGNHMQRFMVQRVSGGPQCSFTTASLAGDDRRDKPEKEPHCYGYATQTGGLKEACASSSGVLRQEHTPRVAECGDKDYDPKKKVTLDALLISPPTEPQEQHGNEEEC